MMKIFHTATVLLLVLGTASAEIPKPQIFVSRKNWIKILFALQQNSDSFSHTPPQIGVSNSKGLGNFDDGGLGGLEPALKWKTSGSTPSYDWEVSSHEKLSPTFGFHIIFTTKTAAILKLNLKMCKGWNGHANARCKHCTLLSMG